MKSQKIAKLQQPSEDLPPIEKLTPEILVDDEVSVLKTFVMRKVTGSNPTWLFLAAMTKCAVS